MRIIAVDDERLALAILIKQLRKVVPEAEIVDFTKSREAFAYLTRNSADIAMLDINMGNMNGLEFAKKCKDLCPKINIIFVTGHSQYALEAYKIHASGYIMKPVSENDLLHEFENLRNPFPITTKGRVQIQTFGNFEIFVDKKPLSFPRSKCKECLAYLVDRKGAAVTVRELAAILWEDRLYDRKLQNNTQTIISDMIKILKKVGIKDILVKSFNSMSIDITKIDCDYYRALQGDA